MSKQADTKFKNRIVEFKMVDPRTLVPNSNNPKEHTDFQRSAMDEVLGNLGWIGCVSVNKNTMNIVDGHMRVEEAIRNDEKLVPVLFLDLTEAEENDALLIFDSIRGFAKTNHNALDNLLRNTEEHGQAVTDLLTRIARQNHIDFGDYAVPQGTRERAVEEDQDVLVEKFNIVPGCVFEITGQGGVKHRLMCGDSMNQNHIQGLLGKEKSHLLIADPPYGIDYSELYNGNPLKAERINNDDLKGDSLRVFIATFLKTWMPFMTGFACYYVFSAQLAEGFSVFNGINDSGIAVKQQIIWGKDEPSLSRSDYHWGHEVCWYAYGANHNWFGGRSRTDNNTLWQVKRDSIQQYYHPNQKPTELFAQPIRNHTKPEDIVLDPFAGSCSVMIECDIMKRRCLAMDNDPKFIAVALQRLTNLGMTFDGPKKI